jgi:hypothetical protein
MKPIFWKIGSHFFVFVRPDRVQSPSDQPDFNDLPPSSGELLVTSIRHLSNCLPEHLVEQSENFSAALFGQAKPAALIVEDTARGAAPQRSGGGGFPQRRAPCRCRSAGVLTTLEQQQLARLNRRRCWQVASALAALAGRFPRGFPCQSLLFTPEQ